MLEERIIQSYIPYMAATVQTYENLENEVLHLPLSDRSRLASRLLESLDDGEDVSEEWLSEIRRRSQSIDDGTAILVPHDHVMANARDRIAKVRK
jgi:putative addiction module component (TIGR02574 family)